MQVAEILLDRKKSNYFCKTVLAVQYWVHSQIVVATPFVSEVGHLALGDPGTMEQVVYVAPS